MKPPSNTTELMAMAAKALNDRDMDAFEILFNAVGDRMQTDAELAAQRAMLDAMMDAIEAIENDF